MAVRHEGNVAGKAEEEGSLEKVIVPAKILLRLLQSFSLVIQVVGVVVVVLPVMDHLSD